MSKSNLTQSHAQPNHILIEGLDRLGKDTLIQGIQNRCGYHQVIHYRKPCRLDYYAGTGNPQSTLRRYQEASFRTMFQLLCGAPSAKIICNRAHLGECVYAPIYRGYSGEYVLELEQSFRIHSFSHIRLVLLVEDFATSNHIVDDGQSLGSPEKRQEEQELFVQAFNKDKRVVCVTNAETGSYRERQLILEEVLAT